MPFHISCICSSLSSVTMSCETLSIVLTSQKITTQVKLISPQPPELVRITVEKFKIVFVTTHFRWAMNAIRPSKYMSKSIHPPLLLKDHCISSLLFWNHLNLLSLPHFQLMICFLTRKLSNWKRTSTDSNHTTFPHLQVSVRTYFAFLCYHRSATHEPVCGISPHLCSKSHPLLPTQKYSFVKFFFFPISALYWIIPLSI